jgi:hypothetical protein
MDNLFHLTALMLIIIWAIGFFVLGAGIFIHTMLIIAGVAIFLAIIQRKRNLEG